MLGFQPVPGILRLWYAFCDHAVTTEGTIMILRADGAYVSHCGALVGVEGNGAKYRVSAAERPGLRDSGRGTLAHGASIRPGLMDGSAP